MTSRSRVLIDAAGPGAGDGPFPVADLLRAIGGHSIGRATEAGKPAIFYRDPARAFGADVRADDVVLLTDLSPLTNPTWHSQSLADRYAAAMEAILAVRPLVIVTGRYAAESLRANYAFPPERLAIAPSYSKASAQVRPGGTRRTGEILAVGSDHLRDNLVTVVEAFNLSGLARRNMTLRLLVTAADGAPNPYVAEAKALLRYAASTNEGVRLEYIDSAAPGAAYAEAAAFVYAPYLDGVGAPLITATAMGVPCVTSLTGICPEVAGCFGTCVDPDDPEKMASALVDLLIGRDDEPPHDQHECARWIDEHYSFEAFAIAVSAALSRESTAGLSAVPGAEP